MVNAVANVVPDPGGASVSGPGVSGPGVSSTGAGKGHGDANESMFAQVLEGMGATSKPVPEARVDAPPLLNARDEVATDSGVQSLVALLAEPLVIQIPVPTAPTSTIPGSDAPLSFTASGRDSLPMGISGGVGTATTGELSSLAATAPASAIPASAPTSVQTSTVPAAVSETGHDTPSVDLQWLRAMTGAARGTSDAAATPAISSSSLRGVNATMPPLLGEMQPTQGDTPVPGQDLDNNSAQTLIQMLAHTVAAAPVMAATLARDDRAIAIDLATDVTAPTDMLAGITPAASQPAGTAHSEVSTLNLPTRAHVQAAVGSHNWAAELGNKLTLLATRDAQSATLYMTPADLGPVQVRIEMKHDQASVWFTAEHPDTRSALEQALPKLRELFSAQGMSLTDAGVFGNRSHQQGQPHAQPHSGNSGFAGPLFASDEALADTATVRSLSLSMLDTYA